MTKPTFLKGCVAGAILSVFAASMMAQPATPVTEGTTPKLEFAFEEAVTLGRNVNVGETPLGGRNFIPITGGTVSGPKFKGKVVSGGWDWQLHVPNGCGTISADMTSCSPTTAS